MVYVDNAKARISASPHTLTTDGYVYLNVTSKSFGGHVDFCFGFADKQAFPTSLEIYDPQTTFKQHQLNLNAFPSTAGYRVNYNFSKKTDNTFLKGYVSVEYDTNFLSASNQTARGKSDNLTLNSSWKTVLRQYIDVGYLDSQMLYWNTTETTYWRSLSSASSFEKEAFSFQGMNTWYQTKATVETNKEYYLRLFLTLVPSLDGTSHEFFVALKPSAQSFNQAVANGAFSYLDPWYYTGWNYKRSHVINPASYAGSGYQIPIIVHYSSGSTVPGNDVYCNTHCNSDFTDIRFTNAAETNPLNYWYETPVNGTATFWVQIPDDLTSNSVTIYIYYGNSGATTTTSNGQATFPDFFDDFSANNSWVIE
jgi:hypothetical protein